MNKKHQHKSALQVNQGIEQPSPVNNDAVNRFKGKKKKLLSSGEYLKGIREGNHTTLSQAITLVESTLPAHQKIAQEIINSSLAYSGKSIRIGITGVPGVGKSTFIESFGTYLSSLGHKIAVLAVDPSSNRSKGSILGDKTRMEALVKDKNAFIRPSPSGGSLGGVARKTRETIVLCEAAGFDIIIIETVGVGQSETAVHSMVDFFLLLMLAGAGDELQGIKRGIMEMADLIAINKADGDNKSRAKLAKAEYSNALHLFPPASSGWTPRAITCSALNHSGTDEIWNLISEYLKITEENGYFQRKRHEQSLYWMNESIDESLKKDFETNPEIQKLYLSLKDKVLQDEISSYQAANMLLKKYFHKEKNI